MRGCFKYRASISYGRLPHLLPLDMQFHFSEQDVPFSVLYAATDDPSEQGQPSTLGEWACVGM